MSCSGRVGCLSVFPQMYDALYDLNIEPDFVQAGNGDLARYRVLLVPPLYSASEPVLRQVSEYVRGGGHVVMAFKSGFTNEHSTVRDVMAPGPLCAAACFHYQEFTNLAEPARLAPDTFGAHEEDLGSVWQELLVPDSAEVLVSFQYPPWQFPALTRNRFGRGTLTYEATVVTSVLQREIVRDALRRAGLAGPDQQLPLAVRVRHGRNGRGAILHYY